MSEAGGGVDHFNNFVNCHCYLIRSVNMILIQLVPFQPIYLFQTHSTWHMGHSSHNSLQAVIVQLERENESMSSTNAGNDNELKQLRVELSQANSDKARLEKENMKQKREVRAMTVGSREGTPPIQKWGEV